MSMEKDTTKKVNKKEVETTKNSSEANNQAEKSNYKQNFKPFNKSFGAKRKRKFCKFCAKGIEHVDYKDVDTLKKYLNHHLKIVSGRITGTCPRHQRRVSNAIKRARVVALIPFVIKD